MFMMLWQCCFKNILVNKSLDCLKLFICYFWSFADMKEDFLSFCIPRSYLLDDHLLSQVLVVHPSRFSRKNVSLIILVYNYDLGEWLEILFFLFCHCLLHILIRASFFLYRLCTESWLDWFRYCDNDVFWELHWHCMCALAALSVLFMVVLLSQLHFLLWFLLPLMLVYVYLVCAFEKTFIFLSLSVQLSFPVHSISSYPASIHLICESFG